MIDPNLYTELTSYKFSAKTADGNSKEFKLEFDKERRCFRLRQVGESRYSIGANIDHECEASFRAALGETDYFEKITPTKPFRNYILIDGFALKKLLDAKNLTLPQRETDSSQDLLSSDRLAQSPFTRSLEALLEAEKAEEEILKTHQVDRNNVQRRVWISKSDRLKTCIDNQDKIFIYSKPLIKGGDSEPEQSTVIAFRDYLLGKGYMRFKDEPLIPVPLWPARRFGAISTPKGVFAAQGEGGDDIATAVVGSKIPLEAKYEAQAFAIFPSFMEIIAGGIKSIRSEGRESAEELGKLEDEIAHCQSIMKEFFEAEDYSPQKAKECLAAMQQVKESLEELPSLKITAHAAASGNIGATLMFSAICSYELGNMMNLIDKMGVDLSSVTQGYGSLKLGNYGSGDAHGLFTVGGTGILIGGELIMMTFVLSKILSSSSLLYHEIKEIKGVKSSAAISDLAKKIIIDAKKDEAFLNGLKIIGNITTITGQALGLSPIAHVGMALAIGGTVIATSADMAKEKRHDFEKEASDIDEAIADHFNQKMVEKVLSFVLDQSATDEASLIADAKESYATVAREQAFSAELLFHVLDVSLAMQKILKQSDKTGDFYIGAKEAEKHYDQFGRGYQFHLKNAVRNLVDATIFENEPQAYESSTRSRLFPKLDIEESVQYTRDMGEFAYKLFHQRVIEALRLRKDDSKWIVALGSKLSAYKKGDLDAIKEMSEIADLPAQIGVALNKIATSGLPDFSHEELVANIQLAYVENRLSKNIGLITTEVKELGSEEACAEALQQSFLKDEAIKTDFMLTSMQEEYKKENPALRKGAKDKGKYESDQNSFLRITGIVLKSTRAFGGLFKSKHEKNVYKPMPEALPQLTEKVAEEVNALIKYNIRSASLRAAATTSLAGTRGVKMAAEMGGTMRAKTRERSSLQAIQEGLDANSPSTTFHAAEPTQVVINDKRGTQESVV